MLFRWFFSSSDHVVAKNAASCFMWLLSISLHITSSGVQCFHRLLHHSDTLCVLSMLRTWQINSLSLSWIAIYDLILSKSCIFLRKKDVISQVYLRQYGIQLKRSKTLCMRSVTTGIIILQRNKSHRLITVENIVHFNVGHISGKQFTRACCYNQSDHDLSTQNIVCHVKWIWKN